MIFLRPPGDKENGRLRWSRLPLWRIGFEQVRAQEKVRAALYLPAESNACEDKDGGDNQQEDQETTKADTVSSSVSSSVSAHNNPPLL
jgi:hypothetical protein